MSVHAWPYYKRTGEHFMKLFVSDFHRQMLKASEILESVWLKANLSVKTTDRMLHHERPPCCLLPYSDPCTLPAEYGDCRDSEIMWFFNPDSGMCEEFEYSGCHGNQNRFPDKQSCEQRCNVNIIDTLPRVSKYGKCRLTPSLH